VAAGVTVLVVAIFTYLAGPMSQSLGVSSTVVQGALSLHLATLIVAFPLGGYFADQIGPRRLIMISAVAYGLSLAAIGVMPPSVPVLYLLFFIAGFAGMGVTPAAYNRVIVHRFDRHRGIALGIALSGGGLADILLPPIIRPLVAEHGWQAGFLALGAIAAAVGLIVGALAGAPTNATMASGRRGERLASDYSMGEALRTRPFWQMTIVFMLLGAVIAGSKTHFVDIWKEMHWDVATLPMFQAQLGLAVIAGRLIGGLAMDRIPAQWVGAIAAYCGGAGIALLAAGEARGLLFTSAAVGIGLCTGAESDVVSYLSSRFFGLANFARIYGLQASFFLIGFSLGPVLASAAGSVMSYATALLIGAAMLMVSGTALLLVRAPASRDSVAGEDLSVERNA